MEQKGKGPAGGEQVQETRDPVLQEDLERVADDAFLLEGLRGKRVVVTGATGLVGSWLIRALACMNRRHDAGMHIRGILRNREKAEKIYGSEFLRRSDVSFLEADITHEIAAEDAAADLVIHGAAVTASRTMVEQPVETILTAVEGTKHVLDYARACGASRFLYLSSMEMYGSLEKSGDTRATEDRLGWLDLTKIRSNYPESKRMCENLCIGYGKEYGLDVRIARLSQTFGAGILPWENRVFAQFARSAMEGKDIVLHTKGLSEGNYCYTGDCVRGILTIALKGRAMEAYNVSNESTHTTIAGMAEMVAGELAGGRVRVVYDIPEENRYGYAADVRLVLDASKLRGLGWEPEIGLKEMYRRMMASMRFAEQNGTA